MIINYKIIGQEIKHARKTMGISQEELAFKCNMSREYISLIENGKKHPSLEIIFILQEILNVPFYKLLTGTESTNYFDLKLNDILQKSEDLEKELYLNIIYLIKNTIDNFKM